MPFTPKLEQNNWPLVEDYLKTKTSIILPIGSTEQHGPTGLLGTDFLTSQAIAQDVGEKTKTLVAPTLPFGNAQHHMAFKGTMTLRPETYINVLIDLYSSLAKHGFTQLFMINGHGGNIAPVTTSLSGFYAQRTFEEGFKNAFKGGLYNWWMGPNIAKLINDKIGAKEGQHATVTEVALTEFLNPDLKFNHPEGKAPDAKSFSDFTDANDFRQKFPDGRIGCDLSPSNTGLGKQVFKKAVLDATQALKKFTGD